jgi:uncharacterized protein YhbP (UPF0306 family)
MNNQEEIKKFITDNIGRHKQFALATVDEQGKPWAVCLNLAYDEKFNIIWKSLKTTEHSKHVSANPDVAICIFSETEGVGDFGLYLKAKAREVTDDEELRRLIDVRFTQKGKPAPDVSEFLGDSPARLYYAEVTEAWVNDDRHLKQVVDLEALRK